MQYCNIPISIGRLLAAWLAVRVFSSILTPPALLCKIYYSHIMRYISISWFLPDNVFGVIFWFLLDIVCSVISWFLHSFINSVQHYTYDVRALLWHHTHI